MTRQDLRIAMVTTFYPPWNFGGDGVAVRRLAHALAGRGHRVEIIHDVDAFRMLSGGRNPEPLPEPEGVSLHGLKSRFGRGLSCLATQQLGRPVVHGARIRRILDGGFDVIHFHNISLVGGPGILACGDAIKIYTAHEHWLVCPAHVLWRHNRELCDGRECFRCMLRHGRPPQLWRRTSLLRKNVGHVDAFLTLSRFCADKHRELGFERPFSVMPPFLPAEAPQPVHLASGARPAVPYFLFVGRLEIIKGLQDVIPLFDGSLEAELWIAGDGDYAPELKKLAAGKRGVRFLGRCTSSALRPLYRDAAGVVLPSLCYEVFPLVVLEAFREGAPIVARRIGPFPEIVDQSRGGLLFSTGGELRSALERLLRERDLRATLGESGRRAFHAFWSEEAALRHYFGVIEKAARLRGKTEVLKKVLAAHDGAPRDAGKRTAAL